MSVMQRGRGNKRVCARVHGALHAMKGDNGMPVAWFWISLGAFSCATLLFAVSGFILFRILSQVLPLLEDTRNHVQDLGDVATSAVAHASDTMDIVQDRVSQTMGQAALSGKAAATQALGVGTVLTGIYMATRVAGAVRKMWHEKERAHRKKRSWWRRGK